MYYIQYLVPGTCTGTRLHQVKVQHPALLERLGKMAKYANADSQYLTYVTLATSKHVDDDFFDRWREDHHGQTVSKGDQGDDASTLEWRVVDASHN